MALRTRARRGVWQPESTTDIHEPFEPESRHAPVPTKATTDASDPASPHKLALAWTHTARFLTTASQLDQLPITELPEIAFVGRSNAGKSTAINTLTQQGRLAFASKTPGRTQHINLFELGPKNEPNALFADLPGYGYAAVARGAKLRWQQVMADYLSVRRSLSARGADGRLPTWLHRPRSSVARFRRAPAGQRSGQAAGAADQGRQAEPAGGTCGARVARRPFWPNLRPSRPISR